MARDAVAAVREDHRPGQRGWPPPEFAVDEVAQPSSRERKGNQRRDEVSDLKKAVSASPRQQRHHCQYPDKPAVKRHASFPQDENFRGMGKVIGGLVEQHVAKAPAGNHGEHAIKDDVLQVAHGDARCAVLNAPAAQYPC